MSAIEFPGIGEEKGVPQLAAVQKLIAASWHYQDISDFVRVFSEAHARYVAAIPESPEAVNWMHCFMAIQHLAIIRFSLDDWIKTVEGHAGLSAEQMSAVLGEACLN